MCKVKCDLCEGYSSHAYYSFAGAVVCHLCAEECEVCGSLHHPDNLVEVGGVLYCRECVEYADDSEDVDLDEVAVWAEYTGEFNS